MDFSKQVRLPVAASLSMMAMRRNSEQLLDQAEDLVDKLEELSDILSSIEAKYVKEDENESEDVEEVDEIKPEEDTDLRDKLVDSLESAKMLIGCLRREKWRLSRREMSVDLRLGELEDYKKHLKNDVTSMNETVDILSLRVVQLENSLCEAQMEIEQLEEVKTDLEKQVEVLKQQNQSLSEEKHEHQKEFEDLSVVNKQLKTLRKEKELLELQMSALQAENSSLKDMIRNAEKRVPGIDENSFDMEEQNNNEKATDIDEATRELEKELKEKLSAV